MVGAGPGELTLRRSNPQSSSSILTPPSAYHTTPSVKIWSTSAHLPEEVSKQDAGLVSQKRVHQERGRRKHARARLHCLCAAFFLISTPSQLSVLCSTSKIPANKSRGTRHRGLRQRLYCLTGSWGQAVPVGMWCVPRAHRRPARMWGPEGPRTSRIGWTTFCARSMSRSLSWTLRFGPKVRPRQMCGRSEYAICPAAPVTAI